MKRVLYIFILCLIGTKNVLFAQTNYFVSTNGNDNNKGTLEYPFKTIQKAQMKARKTEGDVSIVLRGGVYRLMKPLVFTYKDGDRNKKLKLRTYMQERVIICGSILLKPQWKPFRGSIKKALIPLNFPIDMLFVNGIIRPQARYPNFDSTAIRFNGVSEDATSPSRVKKWKNPIGGYLHVMHSSDWGDFHYRISGKSDKGELALEGGWQNNRKTGLSQQNRMVENVFEELDAPGEWYYDIKKSELYYYPLKGEDINHATFETARLKNLIEFRGTLQNPVRNISIEGIEITQTNRTFMEKYEPLLRSDWSIYRGAAIFIEGTENCGLHNCYLHNLGGNAVFFSNYNRCSVVSSSHFFNIGASAICFVGDPNAVRSPCFEYNETVPIGRMDLNPGPKTDNYPAHCLVFDNLIHKIGLYEKQVTGVELSMSQYITVSHNSIYDTPRAGINISEGTWGGHIIEYNDVFDTVKETGDHGSFNSWGRDRYWNSNRKTMDSIVAVNPSLILADAVATNIIRNNRFRCDRGWDIDLDDGSSNYHIYNNLCLNGGIKLREGFYRKVENNILVNNTLHPHVWFRNGGDVFTRNIIMTPYQPINIKKWGTEVDYNVFTDSIAYLNARKVNTDKNSIVVPVHFANTQAGDYMIDHNDSAVFRIGFQNFEMDYFGVISTKLKLMAKTPKFSVHITNRKTIETDIVSWQGLRIKTMNTNDERSATGMDSERGVYVMSVLDCCSPLKDVFQVNDVILKIGDMVINNMDDFRCALKKINLNESHRLVVFRNQKEKIIRMPPNTIRK